MLSKFHFGRICGELGPCLCEQGPGFARGRMVRRDALDEGLREKLWTHEYLLAWRMAVAKDLLRRKKLGLTAVAERAGYRSASTFSIAFSRHVGQPPGAYARAEAA
jgi:AraC-like DNA-binding protein